MGKVVYVRMYAISFGAVLSRVGIWVEECLLGLGGFYEPVVVRYAHFVG